MDDSLGKSMDVGEKRMKKKKKKTTLLLPEDQVDRYLSYQVRPVPRTLVQWDPVEGARLEKMREQLALELDRMRREYHATGRITYELEITDDEQDEEEEVEEKENQVEVEQDAAVGAAVVRPPIIAVGRSSRRRFRQGMVKRAGGGYTKIV